MAFRIGKLERCSLLISVPIDHRFLWKEGSPSRKALVSAWTTKAGWVHQPEHPAEWYYQRSWRNHSSIGLPRVWRRCAGEDKGINLTLQLRSTVAQINISVLWTETEKCWLELGCFFTSWLLFCLSSVGSLFFVTTNQCFSSVSAIELFIRDKKLFV